MVLVDLDDGHRNVQKVKMLYDMDFFSHHQKYDCYHSLVVFIMIIIVAVVTVGVNNKESFMPPFFCWSLMPFLMVRSQGCLMYHILQNCSKSSQKGVAESTSINDKVCL